MEGKRRNEEAKRGKTDFSPALDLFRGLRRWESLLQPKQPDNLSDTQL